MTTKPEPLTEAEERELRGKWGDHSGIGRLFATLDATRAQLASAQNAIVLTDADLQEERRKREASEEEYRQFRMSARAQLTAAIERAEKVEGEWVDLREDFHEMKSRAERAEAERYEAKRLHALDRQSIIASKNSEIEEAIQVEHEKSAGLRKRARLAESERDAAQRETARLRGALEWYANEANYFESIEVACPGELLSAGTVEETVLPDRGERAQKALASSSEPPKGGENG